MLAPDIQGLVPFQRAKLPLLPAVVSVMVRGALPVLFEAGQDGQALRVVLAEGGGWVEGVGAQAGHELVCLTYRREA